jgi:NADPH-dependent 7-cyano-7-deazaguanine reductase QueF
VLADALATEERGMVLVTRVTYASVCPHHLLPSWGVAHVGYLPDGRIVGLGALVRLVEAFSRRLVLQEALGRQVAEALVTHLGARAAGVALDAAHACLSTCGERQGGARVVTHALDVRGRDLTHQDAERGCEREHRAALPRNAREIGLNPLTRRGRFGTTTDAAMDERSRKSAKLDTASGVAHGGLNSEWPVCSCFVPRARWEHRRLHRLRARSARLEFCRVGDVDALHDGLVALGASER